MDEKLDLLLAQMAAINASLAKVAGLADRVERMTIDLAEFSERFEEVVADFADERRLDLQQDYR